MCAGLVCLLLFTALDLLPPFIFNFQFYFQVVKSEEMYSNYHGLAVILSKVDHVHLFSTRLLVGGF